MGPTKSQDLKICVNVRRIKKNKESGRKDRANFTVDNNSQAQLFDFSYE